MNPMRAEEPSKGVFEAPKAYDKNAEANATLIVYNKLYPEAEDLARFYAEKRQIPKDQIVGLTCSITEQITREEYDRLIAAPLRRTLSTNFLWKLREEDSPLGPVESNKIRYIALIRGMPLKIAAAPGYPGDQQSTPPEIGTRNEASLDSELSTLGTFSKIISGGIMNPIFRGFTRIRDAGHPEYMLVCRLDAPTAEMVRRMITDSIATEEEGLRGFAYIDARGITDGNYVVGDKWLQGIAVDARRKGTPVIFDNGPDLFPASYPMRQAAFYFGWYAEAAGPPFTLPDFRFSRGAIAVHIHSFSAQSLREPIGRWVAPLIAAGAAASLGNVEEPYLALTPHLDVFHDRLRAGFTFAESAYMSQNVLSWMTTFVGDPLYRPFRGSQELAERPATGEWAEYRKGAQLWFEKGRPEGTEALRAAGKKLRSGVIMEGLGLLELNAGDVKAALTSFASARQFYSNGDDAMRVAIHEINQLRAANRDKDAAALATKMIKAYPNSVAVELVRALTAPPPPAPVAP